jgi:hypothetical protein
MIRDITTDGLPAVLALNNAQAMEVNALTADALAALVAVAAHARVVDGGQNSDEESAEGPRPYPYGTSSEPWRPVDSDQSGIGIASGSEAAPPQLERADLRPWHTGSVAHPSTTQILKRLIDDLPDDATIADVQYRLYIIDAVNRGRDEITSGAGIPHEQVADEMRAKWRRAREK